MLFSTEVREDLLKELERFAIALEQMLSSEHYQPQIYLQRLKELRDELERTPREKLPMKRTILRLLKELVEGIDSGASPEEIAGIVEELMVMMESVEAALDLTQSYKDELGELIETLSSNDFTKGLLMMLDDLVKGNLKPEEAAAYLSNVQEIMENLITDIEIFSPERRDLISDYGKLLDNLRTLKAYLLDVDDMYQLRDLLPELRELLSNVADALQSLRARGEIDERTVLPSRDLLEAIGTYSGSPEAVTVADPSASPYLLKLEELIDSELTEETLNRIQLIARTLKKRYFNIKEMAGAMSEDEATHPSARASFKEIRELAERALKLVDDIQLELEEPSRENLKRITQKLEDLNRRITKLLSDANKYLKIDYKYCPRCGHKNPIEATQCERCGFIFSLDERQLVNFTDKPEEMMSDLDVPKELQEYPFINGKILTDRIIAIAQLVTNYLKEDISEDTYRRGIERHLHEISELFAKYREFINERSSTVSSGLEKVREHSEELYQSLLDIWLSVTTEMEEAVELYISALEELMNIDYTVDMDVLKGYFDDIFEASNKLFDILRSIHQVDQMIKSIDAQLESEEGGEANGSQVS